MKNKILIGLVLGLGITAIVTGVIFELQENSVNKTEIICTLKNKGETLTTHKTYTLSYNGDNLKKYSKVFKYVYTKDTEEEALQYKGEGIQNLVTISKDVTGVDISISEEKNTIVNTFVYDLEIFNPETPLEYSSVFPVYSLNDSVKTIVEEIKSWGFTCK